MKPSLIVAVLSQVFTTWALAFIPPVNVLTRDAVSGRRPQPNTEILMRHSIEAGGQQVEIEESFIGDSQRATALFRVPGGSVIASANYEKKVYHLSSGQKVPSHTLALLKYLLTASTDDLLSTLLNERFIRREHLNQFKEGFEPKGDPQSWDVKDYYIFQEGASIKRVKSQAAFAFTGPINGDVVQTVYFLKEGEGVSRLEWKREGQTFAWNFDAHTKLQSPGVFPKRLEFERNGQIIVRTDVIVHRPLKDRQAQDLKRAARTGTPLSSQYEEALKVLLSFR